MTPRFGLVAGPILGVLAFLLVPNSIADHAGGALYLGLPGRITAAMVAWMAVWWMTEAISIYVTALLPVVLLPISGVQGLYDTTRVYAHPLVFLAMGGFILALALERWELHVRFARFVLGIVGSGPRRLVGGFMIVGAALSMWISNTAATVIMLPIALSVIAVGDASTPEHRRFTVCLLLAIAYACSIGGIGTLIGTGSNMFLASFAASELQRDLSFVAWMRLGVPIVLIFLPLTWLLLTRVIFRLPATAERDTAHLLPKRTPWTSGAKRTFAVFCVAVIGWVASPILQAVPYLSAITDPGVAMFCVVLLFVIPSGDGEGRFLMDWETAVKLPWGVLLLFGGGLALAAAISNNGIGEALALQSAKLQGVPPFVVVLFAVVLMSFLTELTSNLASTATLLPILAAIADGIGIDPLQIIVPTTVAASCAFMLPVATPPNGIVFGSGMLGIPDMIRAGFSLNILGILLISLLVYPFVGMLLN